MNNSVIIDGLRSPIGINKGNLRGVRPDDLSAFLLKKLIQKNNIDMNLYEDLVMGCAFPEASQGGLMAKGVAVLSDLPETTAAKVVNRYCGSSMDALHQVSQSINAGDSLAGIAFGVEHMFDENNERFPGFGVPMMGYNPSLNPNLIEKDYYIGMGDTAENLAKDLDISREDQEEFSVNSHKKALDAQKKGNFDNEIVPITFFDPISNQEITVSKDEGPREPNLEKIQSLNPAFDINGTITAATSSPESIGAAGMIVMDEIKSKELDLKPKFRIKSRAIVGVDWTRMGSGPLPATEKALKKANLKIDDIDVIELNEAFAAQSLYVIRKGQWDIDKINKNGGAIALGHPLGCSGARIVVTLMNVMEQNNSNLGLATMCIGTGQGIATIIERIN
ncbi:MAG: acetyl-CoA C-acyltransferase [Candidatus Marinimicrobia bacterium]|nr:acetyl-CoA C-acyltransferase [Candidatus Neomarinimicrobiota bacterium]